MRILYASNCPCGQSKPWMLHHLALNRALARNNTSSKSTIKSKSKKKASRKDNSLLINLELLELLVIS